MDTERQEYLRTAALETLGPEEYDRLVVTAADARRLGRLRYWQEQLLARIPGGTVRLDEFIAAFDGAPLQRPRAEKPAVTEKATSQPDWMKDAPAWVQEGRHLNEAEWRAGPHLIWMVSFLLNQCRDRPGEDRRHLLFGCACCRQSWDLLQHEAARKLVERCEAFADGSICEADFRAVTVHGSDCPNFQRFCSRYIVFPDHPGCAYLAVGQNEEHAVS